MIWTITAYWFAAVGALLALCGSAWRAWFTFREYRDVRDAFSVSPQDVEQAFEPSALDAAVTRFFERAKLPRVLGATRLVLNIYQDIGISALDRAFGNKSRQEELANQFGAWGLVLLGSFGASVSSVIKLVVAYTT
ncbi:hypothetical protein ACGFYQ_01600 [Streptomyces sp. NPDC048258]|uniref:hypothetical protein n=1 Tax=Streptomyces sp. NPDC048258 TaxID=3365527 RepID=UPI00371BAA3C